MDETLEQLIAHLFSIFLRSAGWLYSEMLVWLWGNKIIAMANKVC